LPPGTHRALALCRQQRIDTTVASTAIRAAARMATCMRAASVKSRCLVERLPNH
jgi:hypothetical protein